MTTDDFRHMVSPRILGELLDAADAISAACINLAKAPHPDRCDALVARLASAQHAVRRLRVAMVEEPRP